LRLLPPELHIALHIGTRSCASKHPIAAGFFSHLSLIYSAFSFALSTISDPTSHHEALLDPGWKKAMDEKIAALYQNQT